MIVVNVHVIELVVLKVPNSKNLIIFFHICYRFTLNLSTFSSYKFYFTFYHQPSYKIQRDVLCNLIVCSHNHYTCYNISLDRNIIWCGMKYRHLKCSEHSRYFANLDFIKRHVSENSPFKWHEFRSQTRIYIFFVVVLDNNRKCFIVYPKHLSQFVRNLIPWFHW